jgi:hypothetical protein
MITDLEDNMLLVMAEEINEILAELEAEETIKHEINDLFGVYNILSKNNILTPISELKISNITVNSENFVQMFLDLQKDLFKSLRFGLDSEYIGTIGSNKSRIEFVIGQLYGYLGNYIDQKLIHKKEIKVMKFFNRTKELAND